MTFTDKMSHNLFNINMVFYEELWYFVDNQTMVSSYCSFKFETIEYFRDMSTVLMSKDLDTNR